MIEAAGRRGSAATLGADDLVGDPDPPRAERDIADA
jgi:hypothetical protein